MVESVVRDRYGVDSAYAWRLAVVSVLCIVLGGGSIYLPVVGLKEIAAEFGDRGGPADPAYFRPLGTSEGWEVFHATGATVSAWGPDLQHGAPPSALLTRAMDRLDGRGDRRLARIAVDLLGPVPLGEIRTRARVVRPSRRIELLEAELVAGGRVAARASAWRMRCADTSPAEDPELTARVLPEASVDDWFGTRWSCGFIDSLQFRIAEDRTVWARPTVPLVAGEEPTSAERVMMIADIANGVGAVLDPRHWRFLNTDLVVHLHRAMEGRWLGVDARASIGADGIGSTTGRLFDTRGPIGSTAQALLVEPA